MDVEYGIPVLDKNGKAIGTIGKIIMDIWTGKPRKYMVRQELNGPDAIMFFSPEQIGEAAEGKIKLKVSAEELSQP
jgi:sporulation protein YlmC with PRC-barrel domain